MFTASSSMEKLKKCEEWIGTHSSELQTSNVHSRCKIHDGIVTQSWPARVCLYCKMFIIRSLLIFIGLKAIYSLSCYKWWLIKQWAVYILLYYCNIWSSSRKYTFNVKDWLLAEYNLAGGRCRAQQRPPGWGGHYSAVATRLQRGLSCHTSLSLSV